MNDIIINWKKISKGITQERHDSDDSTPIADEIHKLPLLNYLELIFHFMT